MNKLFLVALSFSFSSSVFAMGAKKIDSTSSANSSQTTSGGDTSNSVNSVTVKFIPSTEDYDSCYYRITDELNHSAVYQLKIPSGKTATAYNSDCSLSAWGFESITGNSSAALPNLCRTSAFKVAIYGTVMKSNPDRPITCSLTRLLDSQSAVKNCSVGKTCYSDNRVQISRTGANEFQYKYSSPITEHVEFYADFNFSTAYINYFKTIMAPIYTNVLNKASSGLNYTYDIQNTLAFRVKYPYECRVIFKEPYQEEFERNLVVFRSSVECEQSVYGSLNQTTGPIRVALGRQCSALSATGDSSKYMIDLTQVKASSTGYNSEIKQKVLYGNQCN